MKGPCSQEAFTFSCLALPLKLALIPITSPEEGAEAVVARGESAAREGPGEPEAFSLPHPWEVQVVWAAPGGGEVWEARVAHRLRYPSHPRSLPADPSVDPAPG